MSESRYAPLNAATIGNVLADLDSVRTRLGGKPEAWTVREVGDGNLNLVFIVEGAESAVVVKQALPYVRLVGESWPLPLERSYFEANALRIHSEFAPGLMPEVFHVDRELALIVMEYLSPHIVLRKGLVKGIRYPKFAAAIAEFMAQTLFHTSPLASSAKDHKARVELFAANTALCKITEDLVFTDPYRKAELNRWTGPFLDDIKKQFEQDTPLKLAVQRKKWQFLTETQALIHGDLHTGSIMVTPSDTRVIDPEFAFAGPMAFDIGAVIGNLLLAFFSHAGQAGAVKPGDYSSWLLQQTQDVWEIFERRFLDFWDTHPCGDAYGGEIFEPEAETLALRGARLAFTENLLSESLEFAGCKMIRRILGLAHVEDMESIANPEVRAKCERLALHFARDLLLRGRGFASIVDVTNAAASHVC